MGLRTNRIAARARGFTLVEAMIVVAIIGILASLAVYGVRKYILASKTTEATQMIGSIKSAQAAYRGDTFNYLDVSGIHALPDMTTFYPTQSPKGGKYAWGGGTDPISKAWATLNVQTDGGVYFAYGCAAGGSNDPVAAQATSVFGKIHDPQATNWPTVINGPWFVVKAIADLDGDGKVASMYESASFTESIFMTQDQD